MNNDITKMQYKALREKVQEHEDALAKLKRYLEDALSNISSDNFSKEFRMEQDNFKAEIRLAADELSSVYRNSDELSQMQSEIRQNAERILLCASKEYVDGKISTALLEVSAEKIKAEVKSEVTNQISGITISSDKIVMTTGSTLSDYRNTVNQRFKDVKSGAEDASVKNDCLSSMGYFEPTANQPVTTLDDGGEYIALVTSNSQQKMLCKYNDSYYYYTNGTTYGNVDRGKSVWVKTNEPTTKSTMFTMDKNGFHFTGNVNIDGDLIADGTISGEKIETSSLACSKIYSTGFTNPDNSPFFAVSTPESITGHACFGLYEANKEPNPQYITCHFGAEYSYGKDLETGAIHHATKLYAMCNNFLSIGNDLLNQNPVEYYPDNNKPGRTYAEGIWDFTNAFVILPKSTTKSSGRTIYYDSDNSGNYHVEGV